MKTAPKIIYIICGIVLLLHVWGAINPTHDNWGFHFFGFYDGWIPLSVLIMVVLFFIPKVQSSAIRFIESIIRMFRKLPYVIAFIITAAVLIVLIYIFPVKLHLLGDGAILLRSVSRGITGDEITLSFRNQPLMFWIYKTAMALHPFEAAPDPWPTVPWPGGVAPGRAAGPPRPAGRLHEPFAPRRRPAS